MLNLRSQVAELLALAEAYPVEADELAGDVSRLEGEAAALRDAAAGPERSTGDGEHPALMLISAGVGGAEAADFAQLLARMYLRFFERDRIPYELLGLVPQGATGLRQATLEFNWAGAHNWLGGEAGTHRLTRVSPFNAAGKRQTSFVTVEVVPLLAEVSVELAEAELKWDTFHSGGPGGQGVNTTDSGVRLTHRPTGLTVTIEGRSQTQNKQTAKQVLLARLRQRAAAERHAELQDQRQGPQGWGTQVRSYNLAGAPYVKDHRSGVTRRDAQRVLGGDLTGFLDAAPVRD